ncbi:hypothetical protein CEXT_449801 [Caerostris extrusa]|uniref:Uncharacterized protein n=1 Tax=Caerostris extrusa TaxID=172846 RepID=A0AAV4SQQ0_CAEEX|nr:hypothetical protein CEXT_449801 [Caerostris extrusa]
MLFRLVRHSLHTDILFLEDVHLPMSRTMESQGKANTQTPTLGVLPEEKVLSVQGYGISFFFFDKFRDILSSIHKDICDRFVVTTVPNELDHILKG